MGGCVFSFFDADQELIVIFLMSPRKIKKKKETIYCTCERAGGTTYTAFISMKFTSHMCLYIYKSTLFGVLNSQCGIDKDQTQPQDEPNKNKIRIENRKDKY